MNKLFKKHCKTILILGFAFYGCSGNDELDTTSNLTYVPDDDFEAYLITEGWDDKMDNYVHTENIKSVKEIGYQFSDLGSLIGIEDFTDLEQLIAYGITFKEVDLSKNKKLKTLILMGSSSELDKIDLSQNVDLEILNLYGNKLQEINLKKLNQLKELRIRDNNLNSLDVSDNIILEILHTSGNSLQCIQVNDNQMENISEEWTKDELTIYSTHCG